VPRRPALVCLALGTCAALLTGLTGTAQGAEPDTYYPAKGNPGIDVSRYDLDLTWKAGRRTLSGTATLRLQASAPAPSFALDLHKRMDVSTLTVNGVPAKFSHEGQDLLVRTPVVPGTPYQVEITYAGKPRTVKAPTSRADDDGLGWHTTPSGQAWTTQKPYGAFTWYPVNDHPSDKALYEVRLAVPGKFVGVSNGRLEDRRTTGAQTITRFTSTSPMASYAVTVAIGPYKRYTQVGPHDLPLTYWLPKGGKDLLGPLEKTPETIAFLESRLGPYPFDRAGVVVTPGLGSVESQTLTTLARDNWKQGKADVREQVAHHLAHAWYGNSVTPNDWRDNWMAEGVATFLQAKYSVSQHTDGWKFWKREFARNDDFYREIYGPPGAYLPRHFDQRNVHYGGALLMERLRAKIGTEAFYAALAEWPAQHRDRSRGRSTYIDYLSAKSGRDLRAWFDAWLNSPTTPPS
jgi:aminopeptidase N